MNVTKSIVGKLHAAVGRSCFVAGGVLAGTLLTANVGLAEDYDYDGYSSGSEYHDRDHHEDHRGGYVGASVGQSTFASRHCQDDFSCDRRDTSFKVFTGWQFLRVLGAELSYVNLGQVDRDGGHTKAHGLNLSAVGNLPLGPINLFGKLGGIYGWSDYTASAPNVRTGSDKEFNFSYGAGVQFDVGERLALRGDWDKYKIKFINSRDYVNQYTVGLVYRY
jgi:OmpA-OmpF porin, OOP family